MTKEEKQLLLKDLCARLPYHLRGKSKEGKLYEATVIYDTGTILASEVDGINTNICCGFKPYLRLMSSMTEEEALKLWDLLYSSYRRNKILEIIIKQECIDYILDDGVASTETFSIYYDDVVRTIDTFDWLNSHHFDYRGLIEKGLALEAPEDMYKN